MANYIFAYHGGKKPESPEAGAEMMAKWNAWISGLGDIMVEPQNPLGMSKTVSASGVADDGGPNPLMGYSVITADSLEAALEIAKGSPFLDVDGTIEVAELMQMPS